MSFPWNSKAPTHLLYAVDILLFCKGFISNVLLVAQLFDFYASMLGQ